MSALFGIIRVCFVVSFMLISFVPYSFGTTYEYNGPNFSSDTTEHIYAKLTLSDALQTNFSGNLDLTLLPGFSLTLTDSYRNLKVTTHDASLLEQHCTISATDNYGLPSEWDLLLGDEVTPQRNVILRTILYHGLDSNTGTIFYEKVDLSQLLINNGHFDRVYRISLDGPDSTGWSVMAAPVPEPATMLLFGTGLVGLIAARLKRKK
jgi:hypothetical protein